MGLDFNYLFSYEDRIGANFYERAAVKLSINASIGKVLKIDPMVDFYLGLAFNTKKFGAHIGARYSLQMLLGGI